MSMLNTTKDPPGFSPVDLSINARAKRLHDPTLSNRAFAIFFLVTILIAVGLLLAPKAHSADYSWNQTTGGKWSLNTNWTPNVSGGPDSPGLFVLINTNITAASTITLFDTGDAGDAIKTVGRLDIGDTNGNRSFTIAPGSGSGILNFDGNGSNAVLNQLSTSNGDTISAPITLTTSLDIANASANLLTLSGAISSSAITGTQTITNQGTGTGGLTISGAIANGGTGGTVGITQNSSSSALTLSGTIANTYTGLTTVSAGTLTLGKTANVNAVGGDLTINGGSVVYSGTTDEQIANSAKVTITSGSYALGARSETIGQTATSTSGFALSGTGAVTIGSGQLTLANSASMTGGTITLTANSGALQTNADFQFSGGTIDFTGGGGGSTAALNLRGGDGTGITYLASGTTPAQITNSGGGTARVSLNTAASATTVFNIADSASVATELTIGVNVTGGLGNALEKTGAGVLKLTANNTYLGATRVSGGTLEVANNGTTNLGKLAGTSSVTVNSGGTLLLSGSSTVTDRINDSATMTLAGGTFNTGGLSERGGTLAAPTAGIGALTLTATSTINFGAGTTSIIEFAGIGAHIPGTGPDLLITNWNGIPITGNGTERLLFAGTASTFTSQYAQSDVSFNGITGYAAVQFSGFYEVTTAVPEPSTWIGGALVLGLIGWSQRKRFARKLTI